jgi:hypothetical protein
MFKKIELLINHSKAFIKCALMSGTVKKMKYTEVLFVFMGFSV